MIKKLEEADRIKLSDAQKRISGLYEHLMNFYYFTEQRNQTKDDTSGYVKVLADRLAKEFVDSIPQFRKFLRPITRRAKSQWVLKELGIREAHSIASVVSQIAPEVAMLIGRVQADYHHG
jgi:hypothetical protein